MNWTEAQRKTIETRNTNILVSAAAGSGKTAVLIERIKQLVLKDRTDIDRFLITTFTNAASAEMKERLGKAIDDEQKNPQADQKFLKRQRKLIQNANISTFHTFALEIMRRYFYLTDLEPGFKIGDEIQVSLLKGEAMEQLFEDGFAGNLEEGVDQDGSIFREFLNRYSGDRNERKLKENLLSLYQELRSIPHYLTWAKERTQRLKNAPMEELGLVEILAEDLSAGLKRSAGFYKRAADLLEIEGIESLSEKAAQDAERVEEMAHRAELFKEKLHQDSQDEKLESSSLEPFGAFVSSPGFFTMRAAKVDQEAYEPIKKQVGDLRKKGKKILDDLKKKYFQRPLEEYEEELKESYEDTEFLVKLLEAFELRFCRKKRERNLVDFDDVMHYAIEILQDPMAAEEYRQRFRYIFIDEFQDSNMLQEAIVEKIAGRDNVFMVGDVKQSIYKFRLAEPEIFKRKYALYQQASDESGIKIDLNSNFRSKCSVTKTVNCVFERIMEDYDEDARLNCSIDEGHPGMKTQLHIISKARMEQEGVDGGEEVSAQQADWAQEPFEEELASTQLEAAMTAKLIRSYVGQEIYDVKAGRNRLITYGDIAVLSRSRAMLGEMERYLNNEGIPAYGEHTGSYFESVEIQVFLNLLRVIDNSRQDIPLLSVMRSVIFDFSVEELAAVRIACSKGSFHQAVREYQMTGTDQALKEKLEHMDHQLDYWKQMAKTVTLEELVQTLLYDTGYFDYCSGLPVGHQRISNLRLLIRKAAEFEQSHYSGLYGFLDYVEAMKRNRLTLGEATVRGEQEDLVQIMTVHKSKGLEFPVVILTGAGRAIRFRGIGNGTALHKDLAIGMPHVNREERWHRKTILQRAIEGKKAAEEVEEEIRILYVAMTRAMDHLAITGVVKDASGLDPQEQSRASYLDMIFKPMTEAGDTVEVHDAANLMDHEENPNHVSDDGTMMPWDEDPEFTAELDRRLGFVYPYKTAEGKLKYSVSELNRDKGHTAEPVVHPLSRPNFFGEETPLTAAEIGTTMHLVMEKLDFRKALEQGNDYIGQRVDQLLQDGFLSQKECDAVSINNLAGFFLQDVGKRAALALSLEKEREFILQKNIEGEDAIVQGIIDCFFEEEDGLVLIDYKNNYLGNSITQEDIVQRYNQQMELYREALEASTGKPVKEMYLYLFHLRKFVAVERIISQSVMV